MSRCILADDAQQTVVAVSESVGNRFLGVEAVLRMTDSSKLFKLILEKLELPEDTPMTEEIVIRGLNKIQAKRGIVLEATHVERGR